MYIDKFNVSKLDYKMCAAFTGCKYDLLTDELIKLMEKAEKEVLSVSVPKAVYEVFEISEINERNESISFMETDFKLTGKSICKHLAGYKKAVFLSVTLGAEIDKRIRKYELTDLPFAYIFDGMAGVMVETVCDEIEADIYKKFKVKDMTYRFGLGYGDLPIELEHDFLRILNANALIGLNSTESYLLTPCKSVACVIGIK